MGTCQICKSSSAEISSNLGVCLNCIRNRPEEAREIAMKRHADSRAMFGLPPFPPRDPDGLSCGVCMNECKIGPGKKGYCGLVYNINGRLVRYGGTPEKGILEWYYDALPTNCLHGDTKVILGDGRLEKLKNVVERIAKIDPPLCLNFNNWKIEPSPVLDVQKMHGPAKLLEITTESGLSICVTPEHEILVDEEEPCFMPAIALKPGQKVFTIRRFNGVERRDWYIVEFLPDDIRVCSKDALEVIKKAIKDKGLTLKKVAEQLDVNYSSLRSWLNKRQNRYPTLRVVKNLAKMLNIWNDIKSDLRVFCNRKQIRLRTVYITPELLYLLGLLCSDGHVRDRSICFSNTDEKLIAKFKEIYDSLFDGTELREYCRPIGLKVGTTRRIFTRKLVKVLEDTNYLLVSIYKSLIDGDIPFNIGFLPDEHIAAFVAGYTDGDGYVGDSRIAIVTAEKDKAEMLCILLRRLGIFARIFKRLDGAFSVEIMNAHDIQEFHDQVGRFLVTKRDKLKDSIAYIADKARMYSDRLPLITGKLIKLIRTRYSLHRKDVYDVETTVREYEACNRNPSRQIARKILENIKQKIRVDDPLITTLEAIVEANICVEEIKEIKEVDAPEHVYCMTLMPHNFVANLIIVRNCVAWWHCAGCTGAGYPKYAYTDGPEIGYYNLAVFYGTCSLDCLYCQNWHWRANVARLKPVISAEELAMKVRRDVSCICYFGGDPSPQMPHAIRTSEIAYERAKKEGRKLRICWETNGYIGKGFLDKAVKLSLESGGTIKFDLKCFDENLNLALCGVSNKPTLRNFEEVGRKYFRERLVPPLLTASTLLVPGYVDVEEVRGIAEFIASIDPEIPYTLLAFYPCYVMNDLPTTRKEHAYECLNVAKKAGLKHVRIGNIHLLS